MGGAQGSLSEVGRTAREGGRTRGRNGSLRPVSVSPSLPLQAAPLPHCSWKRSGLWLEAVSWAHASRPTPCPRRGRPAGRAGLGRTRVQRPGSPRVTSQSTGSHEGSWGSRFHLSTRRHRLEGASSRKSGWWPQPVVPHCPATEESLQWGGDEVRVENLHVNSHS